MSSRNNQSEDGVTNNNSQYGYRKDFRTAFPQLIAVSVKNLLLLGYGMTLGFPTILIPAVENPVEGEVLHLTNTELSWISSINYIVVPFGCAISGIVTSPLGRRKAMQVVNIPFFVAWLLFHYASTTAYLYGALILTGLAGGVLEAPVLTYVAEITQPHLRGALTATSSLCIILGVFTQFLFGLFLYWRTVALVNIVFTILAVVALCFVPESPHWLVSKKRHNDAQKSLQWLRGWTNASAVEEELKDIQNLYKRKKVELQDEEESFTEKITHYLERSFYVPFALISFSFFVGHFSGMTTLQTFAVSIFQRLQAPIDKYYATLIIGILQILGTAVCVLLVHYTGKRPLTFFSTGGAAVCCYFVAAYDGYLKYDGVPQTTEINATTATDSFIDDMGNSYSWIPTTLLMLLALLTHTGIRLLPWILIGEIFSAKTRSGGAGLASAVGYIFGFFANKLYIDMVERLDLWGTYGLYGIVCTLGCIIFYFTLPETEGKKLSDIENHFAGVKRLTNTVYRSKKIPNQEDAKMRDLKGAVNSAFEPENSQL
ncbi:facilitated trehalose transporter Tret1 isoform X2 [Achroia grisella]|nr:facilitated trehalose transporter Tret1 isoform X2 [Achroia grisella]XP_059062308.1 facilitated trehalose transporter Tret1 isoform X2 [Achroia grisella]